jgi:hypothetical protein
MILNTRLLYRPVSGFCFLRHSIFSAFYFTRYRGENEGAAFPSAKYSPLKINPRAPRVEY